MQWVGHGDSGDNRAGWVQASPNTVIMILQRRRIVLEMLIQNYGHLWERKYINFGRAGAKGRLCGSKGRRNQPDVDFEEQIGIYILHDPNLQAI